MEPTPHSQLEVIYRQLGRSSGFRGFTAGFVLAVAGASAAFTLVISLASISRSQAVAAVAWVGAGAAIAAAVFSVVLLPALRSGSGIRREAAQAAGIQMAFPLGAGSAVTIAVFLRHPDALPYLPAVWLALFGLGVSSLAGLIRERVEFAAVFYLVAAGVAYVVRPEGPAAFALTVGVPFTLGHALTALIRGLGSDTRRQGGGRSGRE
jgi:hypothetical protein